MANTPLTHCPRITGFLTSLGWLPSTSCPRNLLSPAALTNISHPLLLTYSNGPHCPLPLGYLDYRVFKEVSSSTLVWSIISRLLVHFGSLGLSSNLQMLGHCLSAVVSQQWLSMAVPGSMHTFTQGEPHLGLLALAQGLSFTHPSSLNPSQFWISPTNLFFFL